jgi:glycosyltransferase involved in cell wall biosynthesis
VIWLAVVAAAALLARSAGVALRRRRAPSLPPPLADPPPTLILVPMRDEEVNVDGCLSSLLAQTAPVRVRVIDDGSTDRTAERVAAIAARDPRLSLISAGPLPEGWRGKVHALARGAEGAAEEWILMTDADTRHEPDLLARAHAAARELRLDAVSLAGRQEARGSEAWLTPVVFALLDALLGDWRAAAEGGGPAVANGQYILVGAPALAAAGGLAAVREEPLDDVALARALRSSGARTGFWRASGLRVRMYRGFKATFRGWRRNAAVIFGADGRAAAAALAWLLLPLLVGLAAAGGGAPAGALVVWTAGVASSALLRAGSRHPLWPAVFYPLDALLAFVLLAAALADWRRGHLAAWKGREIRLAGRR